MLINKLQHIKLFNIKLWWLWGSATATYPYTVPNWGKKLYPSISNILNFLIYFVEYFFGGQIKTHTTTDSDCWELLHVVCGVSFSRLTAAPSMTSSSNHGLETPAFANELVFNKLLSKSKTGRFSCMDTVTSWLFYDSNGCIRYFLTFLWL